MRPDSDKPKYRLSDLDVFEVSFVPKAANKRKFLMYKSAEGSEGLDNISGLDPIETFKSEDFQGHCDNCGYGNIHLADSDAPECPFCGVEHG